MNAFTVIILLAIPVFGLVMAVVDNQNWVKTIRPPKAG
jgi:hypothetical protein